MLHVIVPPSEQWDDVNQQFILQPKEYHLTLEHSLLSLSKWESKWHKPFLSDNQKSDEEIRDYIRCMSVTPNVPDEAFLYLTNANIVQIQNYIGDSCTATWFTENDKKPGRSSEQITSELIYYWMVAYQIPFTCEKWHLNRLLTLIRICGIKNQPPKKQNPKDILRRNAALNAARQKKYHTRG